MNKFLKKSSNLLDNSARSLFKIVLLYFFSDLIIRIYEFINLYNNVNFENIFFLELQGFFYDNFKILIISLFLYPIYTLIFSKAPKLIYNIIISIVFIYIVISFLTLEFYFVSLSPLDQIFYQYSLKDLVFIIRSSASISILFYLFLSVLIFLFFYLNKKITLHLKPTIFFISAIWILSISFISDSHVREKNYNDINEYYAVKSKGLYFFEKSGNYFKQIIKKKTYFTPKYIQNLSNAYREQFPEYEFTNINYPLLHKSKTKDVLGKYFNKKKEPPHIVIIIMESLSRAFCGPDARLGNFTPFIDSLIGESLYWENYLSNCERTFGALPNVLGSLPYGKRGFIHSENGIPPHNSLISLLAKQNYHTAFYYGGDVHFNLMDKFLKKNNIDFILKKFPDDCQLMKSNKKGFSWGYTDKSLYKAYFNAKNNLNINKNKLDIILTLSLHNPFIPPNKKYYKKKFFKVYKNLNKSKKGKVYRLKNQMATALYVDDALKYYFDNYKKDTAEFNNTIFFITGDHRMAPIHSISEIDRYHVPLIIYSPLLKKSQKFSSVSSHLDITPSILAFLNKNYNMKFPEYCHWLSNGIDGNIKFRNIHTVAFMRNNKEMEQYLDKGYFYSYDKLYKIKPNMKLKLIKNKKLKENIKTKLDIFKEINIYVNNQNKIMP